MPSWLNGNTIFSLITRKRLYKKGNHESTRKLESTTTPLFVFFTCNWGGGRQVAELRRHRAGEVVEVEVEVRQPSDLGGDGAGGAAGVEFEVAIQCRKPSDLGGA